MRRGRSSHVRTALVVWGSLLFLAGCPQSSRDSLSSFRVKMDSQKTAETAATNAPVTGQQAVPEATATNAIQSQESAAKPAEQPQGAPVTPTPVQTPAVTNPPPAPESVSPSGTVEPAKASTEEGSPAVLPVNSQIAQQAPPATSEPQQITDLLQLVQLEKHCIFGQWVREGKGLRSPGVARTTVIFPFNPPEEYKLRIVARRVQGSESLNVTLPVGVFSHVMVILEGYGRLASGLNLVAGATADNNETTHIGRIFPPNEPVELEFFSSAKRVAVRAGGKWIIDWSGDPHLLRLDRRYWMHIPPRRIAVSVYSENTVFVIERAELTPCPAGLDLPSNVALVPKSDRPASSRRSLTWPPFGPPPDRFEETPPESRPPESRPPIGGPPPVAQAGSRPETTPALPPITHFNEQPPEEVTQWKDSVGLIEYPLASGTGFVIKEKLVVTNAHVIEGAFVEDLEITFTGAVEGRYRVQRLLYEDPARDLAILYVDCPQKPIPMAASSSLSTGEKVAIISNPSLGDTDLVLRNATVAGLIAGRVHTKGYDFYQVNANVNPGSSGAPLFNWKGEVVGVVAMKATEEGERELGEAARGLDQTFAKMMPGVIRSGMAFAIPGNALAKAIEAAEKELLEPTNRTRDLHAERALFENLAVAGILYLLKFAANVPPEVRNQEELVRMRGIPRMAASKVKLAELMPEDEARAIKRALESSEARELLAFCTKNLDQRLQTLKESPHADQNRVKLLESLMRTVNNVKRNAENPPANYQAYSQTALQQSQNLKDQVSKLKDSFAQLRAAYAD
ncbi:MAG: trypsin-like peptidase domain-containing protein [Thermogutta sp.]